MTEPRGEIYTVGHSTHDIESFCAILANHEIRLLADVRRFPGSRRNPQFNKASIEKALAKEGIFLLHLAGLGGHRKPGEKSANTGWDVDAFQGYADHMGTQEFQDALSELTQEASRRRAAVMCAEGLWWKCHRRLLSDALAARGWNVRHIMPNGEISDHRLTDFAVLDGEDLFYPPAQPTLPLS